MKSFSLILVLMLAGTSYGEEPGPLHNNVYWQNDQGMLVFEIESPNLFDGTWSLYWMRTGLPLVGRVTAEGKIINNGMEVGYATGQREVYINEPRRSMLEDIGGMIKKPFAAIGNAAGSLGDAVQKPIAAVKEAATSVGEAVSSAGAAIKKPFVAIGEMASAFGDKIALVFWLIVGAIGTFIGLCIIGILSRIFGAASKIINEKK